ncbi:MAG: hypothetical protein ABEJ59_05630 [Halanaeroarchaeum sp.]
MRYTSLAIVLVVAALLTVGTAAAQGAGFAAPHADDRPLDGANTPWLADDDRLDRIQERYDLTDAQVAEIQATLEEAMADGTSREEIQTVVHDSLESFGIEVGEPLGLGPADGPRGPAGDRPGYGAGHGFGGHGPMGGQSGLGLRDGSCLN